MYDLHSLGWSGFQQLSLTIIREILAQTVESYLDANDGGRDGAFTGTWNPAGKEELTGRFVIQCKFTAKPNQRLRLSDLSDEIPKVIKLVERGLCDSYVLLTNAGVSGKVAGKITAALRQAGAKHVITFGSTWICQQILENKRLRMLVPRVYGLGDLSQILDARAYLQAQALLEAMREDLAKVVITDVYRKAADALDRHGFVLLIGEPACGKTTIASMLAMASVDQWDASLLKLDDPRKVVDHWNPNEPSQFFWIDDAFGVTQYEEFLARGWNHIFPQVRAILRNGAKIVMTSRDYIYSRARHDLKEGAFPLLRESQVVIDVHALSIEERRQILYNHLKLGRQSRNFRSMVKPFLESIAAHPRFIPETARRLAEPLFTKNLRIDNVQLTNFVERREQLLQEVLQGLDSHSKAALALIYMRNDRLDSPISLQESESHALERIGSTLGKCITALEALNGGLTIHSHTNGDSTWRFKHPTIGDAYAVLLAQSPELLAVYVQGSDPEKLIDQVTCGDVGIEKAVVIPKALYSLIIERLNELSTSKDFKTKHLSTWHARCALHGFLATRCSKEFLSQYLLKDARILDDVSKPGLYLSAVSEVDLAVRLHELGLLPDDKRRTFVSTVSEYAIAGDDVSALASKRIRGLFTAPEFEALIDNVRTRLFPKLDDVRLEMQLNHDSDDSAESHMQPLLDVFLTLERHFGNDPALFKIIKRETELANDWITDNTQDVPGRQPRTLGQIRVAEGPRGKRSIFDDIDE